MIAEKLVQIPLEDLILNIASYPVDGLFKQSLRKLDWVPRFDQSQSWLLSVV